MVGQHYLKAFLFIASVVATTVGFAQDSLALANTKRPGYKKWTADQTSVRFGIGLQRSFFTEIGLARHKYTYNDLGYASKAYYAALEWVPKFSSDDRHVYGVKVGYETNLRVLALGMEVKYQTDFSGHDVVFTPKIGLGMMGVLNVFYGQNISTNQSPFANVGHSQLTLICNLNKQYFKQKKTK